jgi:hypothetical protein
MPISSAPIVAYMACLELSRLSQSFSAPLRSAAAFFLELDCAPQPSVPASSVRVSIMPHFWLSIFAARLIFGGWSGVRRDYFGGSMGFDAAVADRRLLPRRMRWFDTIGLRDQGLRRQVPFGATVILPKSNFRPGFHCGSGLLEASVKKSKCDPFRCYCSWHGGHGPLGF